ncbi:MAG TPA: FTR1 family protein [Thermoanaerobaculia bacterium]|nr:FTR1 family protein [Thermoanaerobaculia bacterium]
MKRLLVVLLLAAAVPLVAAPAFAGGDPSALLQLVDYVGVDYAGAVSAGKVADAGEYAEMQEFATRIVAGVATLDEGPARPALLGDARALAGLVAAKAPPSEVAELTRRMRDGLMRAYPVAVTPRRSPDLARGRVLYQQSCASCHGVAGHADGPAAAALDPPPIDFHDLARARQRSLYGLYNTITLGVAGTGMASFSHLPDDDRWALAFHVGSLFADEAMVAAGAKAWNEEEPPSLREAVTIAPAELAAQRPEGLALTAWVRRNPAALFAGAPDPFATALSKLEESTAAYGAGDRAGAQALAVSAYLDGFELAEAGLSTIAPGLVRTVEDSMLAYRRSLAAGAPVDEIARRSGELRGLLLRAQGVVQERSLGGGVAFASSLVILLREGLEAILILAAIVAFLVRSGRREALVYVHYGWIAALVAGAATWAAATWVIDISGAAREVTEGATALLAAAILFYVGFWMHQATNARRWTRLMEDQMRRALDGPTLFGLSLISFLAVYREVFETVLFYQALWPQVRAGAQGALLGGALAAAVVLGAATWCLFALGVKLPLRQFFAASGVVMFALAVILAGKGMVALQEAGRIPISPIDFPRVELLGLYPTLQSVLAQVAVTLAALSVVWWNRRERPSAQPVPPAQEAH